MITGRQRSELKKMAQEIKPAVMIGKEEITPSVIAAIDDYLEGAAAGRSGARSEGDCERDRRGARSGFRAGHRKKIRPVQTGIRSG